MGCIIIKGYEILIKDLVKDVINDIVIIEFGGNDCDFNWMEVFENLIVEYIFSILFNIFEM